MEGKNEPPKSGAQRPSLEQRFSDHPEALAELRGLRDELERALANGALARDSEFSVRFLRVNALLQQLSSRPCVRPRCCGKADDSHTQGQEFLYCAQQCLNE